MAAPRKKPTRKGTSKAIASGAVGGPSTTAGLNYQINHAVLRLLKLCANFLSFPFGDPIITIEPRIVNSNNEVTRWDLEFDIEGELIEAKLNPTNQDLTEWIDRAAVQFASSDVRFVLACGKATTRRLLSLKHLIRIANECGANDAKFKALVDLEEVPEAASLLLTLGTNTRELLQRMNLRELSEASLSEQIAFYCERLAGQGCGDDLRHFLFAQVSEAGAHRATLHVSDLVKNCGVNLTPIPTVKLEGLDSEVREALLLLNVCPVPLPGNVLATAIGTNLDTLRAAIAASGLLSSLVILDSNWRIVPPPVALPKPTPELCERGLRAVLSFVGAHKHEIIGQKQVYNALSLAQICSTTRPQEVARMFITLDKAVKGIGDKHLVLKAAELAIIAARRAEPRRREEAEGEAQAMICGLSWALQRIDRLDEAMLFAKKSLKLGQDIAWDRNTSYCEKCIGRLYRIMAEVAKDQTARQEYFEASVAHIETAIYLFGKSEEFGPAHHEVGDCHSLLGRTYLSAGNRALATEHARKASQLITEQESKDYLDLCLLQGELQERTDRQAAEISYNEVVERGHGGDSERSEIVARAYFRRAVNRSADGRKSLALADFRKAKELWRALEEEENAARCSWEILKLEGIVSATVLRLFTEEPIRVRVAAIEMHQRRASSSPKSALSAYRSEQGHGYWLQLIKEAQTKISIESREW